jgi:hypothetical protein
MGSARLHLGLALAVVSAGCTRMPPLPPHGTGTLWGMVRLVPRHGVVPGPVEAGPYTDRRLRDVEFVDYGHPGFVVVWVDGRPRADTVSTVTIEASARGGKILPPYSAVPAGTAVTIRNADASAHTISCPALGIVHTLVPGEAMHLPPAPNGPVPIHLLDSTNATAVVFGAPGPLVVATPDGRWELRDLEPGPQRLHAWHPRLPGAEHSVDVIDGRTIRVDLDLGVENLDVHENR